MIPFENCLPYDRIMQDYYAPTCPFCKQEDVLLPLKPLHLDDIRTGKKHLLVLPCCYNKLTLVDADHDYLLATVKVR